MESLAISQDNIQDNIKKRKTSMICLCIILAIVGVFMVLPIIWMFSTAFKLPQEVWNIPPTFFPKSPTLDNFRVVLADGMFFRYMLNSLFVGVVVTSISLFTSSISGYVFAKFNFWGRNIAFWLILSTFMLPFQIIMIPLYELVLKFGWSDSFRGLIIPMICNPFGIFMIRQFMQGVPNDLLDAARIDGCREFRIYWQIILPLLRAPLSALGIFYFMWNWDSFLWPLLVVKSDLMRTLPLGLAAFGEANFTRYHLVMAGSAISVLPVIIVYFCLQKQIIQGVALTGMKI